MINVFTTLDDIELTWNSTATWYVIIFKVNEIIV